MTTEAPAPPTTRSSRFGPTAIALAVPVLIAASMVVHVWTRTDALTGSTGFDEGVYFGTALRTFAGSLPYRDFVYLHPPGIAVLLWPLALLSNLTSTFDAFVVARIATGIVAVVNVGLIGYALRRHGPFTMFVTAMLLAVEPLAFSATHTIMLDPWMLSFCLLAMCVAFDRAGNLAPPHRIVAAGLLLGVAVSIKLWALLFLLPLLAVVCVRRRLRGALEIGGSGLLAFAAIAGPFIAGAPTAFLRDVVGSQIGRRGDGIWQLRLDERLTLVTGLGDYPFRNGTTTAAVVSILIVAAIAVAILVALPRIRSVDIAALGIAALAAVAFSVVNTFYRYYVYVAAASLILAIGVAIGLAIDVVGKLIPRDPLIRTVTAIACGALVVALAVSILPDDRKLISRYLSSAENSAEMLRNNIPAGSCVAFDEPGPLIVADRFVSDDITCPVVIDTFGSMMALNDGTISGPFSDEICQTWSQAFAKADYVTLVGPRSAWVAWCPEVEASFARDFTFVAKDSTIMIWKRLSPKP